MNHRSIAASFWNFNGQNAQDARTTSQCQIWSKLVKLWPRYGDFSIFQDGGRRHLGIIKFENFNAWRGQKDWTVSCAKFDRNWSNRCWGKAIFFIFPRWQPSAILNLWCVCSDHPQRIFGGLYRCAKFGWNRWSSFDNMPVLIFCEFGLNMPIHAPKCFLGDLTP